MIKPIFLNIQQLINQSNKILVTFRKTYSLDTIASALALSFFLEKLGKEVLIFCEKIDFPYEYYSLPKIENIKNDLSFLEKSLISFDISRTKIKEFSYNLEKDKLNILIAHNKGIFNPEEINITSVNPYDLVIILDTPKLDLLGDIYKDHKKIFSKPTINLDYHQENDNFGQINFIDQESITCSEIIFKLITYFDENLLGDEKIKTCLLNGMISDEKNYFIPIKNFNLKLLARALENINNDFTKKISWVILTREDFKESQSGENDLILLIRGLLNYFYQNKLFILIYEHEMNKIKVQILSPNKEINILESFKKFNPYGSFYSAEFLMENINLLEAEKLISEEIE